MIDLVLANPILPAMLLVAAAVAVKEMTTGRGTKPAALPVRQLRAPAMRGGFPIAGEWKRSA